MLSLAVLTLFFATSSLAREDWLISNILLAEKLLFSKEGYQNSKENTLKSVLADPENRIAPRFDIPHQFKKNVFFWAQIYTQFSSFQKVIHDKNDLSIVYDVIDTRRLGASPSLATKQIKQSLIHLGNTAWPKTLHAKKLQRLLVKRGIHRPSQVSPKEFFSKLAKNVRTQTGQRDKIFQGIFNSHPFIQFFNKTSSSLNLPKELLAIAFVESSFNLKATSKVGASGVWQIMPHIAKKLLPRGQGLEPRRNIMLSTIAALHLLSQNFKLLKRWDLAISAYNFGTRNIMRAQKKLKQKDVSLAYIFKNYRSSHLGFASRNFFSSFLAIVYILEYKEIFFPLAHPPKYIKKNPFQYGDVNLFVSKCGFIPQRLYASLRRSSPHISHINNHLKYPQKIYPRGTLILSDSTLPPKQYRKVSSAEMAKNLPKDYPRLIRKEKCI